MTDPIILQAQLEAANQAACILQRENEQLAKALRLAREKLEDLTIELDGYRSNTTIPAPRLDVEATGDGS
jgi:hypothetical protein